MAVISLWADFPVVFQSCDYAFMDYAVDFKVEQRIARSSKAGGVMAEEFDAMNGGYVINDPAA